MNGELRLARDLTRFWERVKVLGIDDCWEWTGATETFGYGRFYFCGRTQTAQRVSWQLTNGPIPVGMCALHKCDNPPCVNPNHLFLGSKTDNAADRQSKGRTRCAIGEAQGSSKLKTSEIEQIKRLRKTGLLQRDIAKRFNVSRSLVGMIVNGKRWSHLS